MLQAPSPGAASRLGHGCNASQRVRRPGPTASVAPAIPSPARPIHIASASASTDARSKVVARMAPTPSGATTTTTATTSTSTFVDAQQQQAEQQQAQQDALQAQQRELELQLPAAEPAKSGPSSAAVLVSPPAARAADDSTAAGAPAGRSAAGQTLRLERGAKGDEQAASVQEAFTPGREGLARRTIFNRISRHYDELNDVLSLGQHWVWKKMAVKWSGARAGQRVLDVCCGSGDIAFLLAQSVGPRGQVVGLDFAAGMLRDAASRQQAMEEDLPAQRRPRMQWVQGDAMSMPFPDEGFDAATMGYGLRNVADIPRTLQELHRVLRPGATVAILDFNNSTDAVVDQLQALALEHVVVPYARRFGLEAEYAYLRPSIKRFPTGPEQERMALEAGFAKATHYPIGFGLMGVLVATKPGRRQL